ncbi:MAG TPA: ROK family protein [Candidatus Baltobacteraceae bacterium]|nr:ROK family protein [Candidatus Baltobacteraceae bacterium]
MRCDERAIGIDLGGTKIEVAVLDAKGSTLLRERTPTPAGNYDAIVASIASLVQSARCVAGGDAPVGIGTPGCTSTVNGLLINSNSTVLIGKPLLADIERAIGCRVRMANDANCMVLSEATDGAAAGADTVFGAILGTGVGGAIAVRGRVLHGASGIAGEWGHNPLPWPREDELPGPACYCGKRACIETFLSGPALAREKTLHGEERALARYEERLARALASIINVLDPGVIVLGGGVSNVARLYRSVAEMLPSYVFSDTVRTKIVAAAHGDSSGVRGAAMLWTEGAYDG